MRWSCPHCGTQLAIAKEKLGSHWSFTRCYSCAGYALIRPGDTYAIKVDKAPSNEKIILPEAFEEPLMNKAAMDRLMSYNKPIVRPAQRRIQTGTQTITQPTLTQPVTQSAQQVLPKKFPDPLPEVPLSIPTQSKIQKLLPMGIAVSGMIAIVSGIYLYIHGQKILKKSREAAEKPALSAITPTPAQAPAGAAAAAAIESAPEVNVAAITTAPVVDQIHQKAMAPEKITLQEPKLMVKPKSNQVKIHSGPGLAYSVIGLANPNSSYIVADWNDRWFKVLILSKKNANESVHEYGWLRNDHVQLATTYGNTNDLSQLSAEPF